MLGKNFEFWITIIYFICAARAGRQRRKGKVKGSGDGVQSQRKPCKICERGVEEVVHFFILSAQQV
jgi:hypothetical protein